jgi:hypothetical protein
MIGADCVALSHHARGSNFSYIPSKVGIIKEMKIRSFLLNIVR